MSSDVWAVAVNMRADSNRWVAGALAYVLQMSGDGANGKVLVRSRSGRWIRVWVKMSMLTNPRVKWVAPGFSVRVVAYEQREWAEGRVERLTKLLEG